jgi:hypothetical protein
MTGGTGVIDGFLATFTQYIDSGFGLVQGDVRGIASVLIAIDITLAGLFWATTTTSPRSSTTPSPALASRPAVAQSARRSFSNPASSLRSASTPESLSLTPFPG